MAPISYTSSIGMFSGRRRRPGRPAGWRRCHRAPAEPLRRLQAGERGQRPGLLARGRHREHRRAADDRLRRRARPGDDQRPDQGDRRGGARDARSRCRSAARRSTSTPRTSRATLIAASRTAPTGAHVFNLPGVVADGPRSSAAIEAPVPGAADLIEFEPGDLPFPSEIDHDGIETIDPLPITPLADGVAETVEILPRWPGMAAWTRRSRARACRSPTKVGRADAPPDDRRRGPADPASPPGPDGGVAYGFGDHDDRPTRPSAGACWAPATSPASSGRRGRARRPPRSSRSAAGPRRPRRRASPPARGSRGRTARTRRSSPTPRSTPSTSRSRTRSTTAGRWPRWPPASTCCARSRTRAIRTRSTRPSTRPMRPASSSRRRSCGATTRRRTCMRDLLAEIGPLQVIRATFGFVLAAPYDVRIDADLEGGSLMDVGCYTSAARGCSRARSRTRSSATRWSARPAWT